MIGKTVSHYHILEKLGGGGMGVVYKAEDLKLKRTVALKFLPPELIRDDEAKKRFIHEAQAASALEHTNICNIHEIDDTEKDRPFICMAYYKGEILKEKIKEERLKIKEAVDYVIQIAQGLKKAHEHGIIHRDIKPANIMLTDDGVVKILDFGLAKLASQTKLTREGTSLGTVAYMSPEQARGEEVDKRSDIWSLGVVMYEMITGELPFKGDYGQAQVYSILNENPEPITGLRSGVPMDLELIINKALYKDPDERYQHAEDLVADLTRLQREHDSYKQIPTTKPVKQRPLRKSYKRFIALVAAVLVIALILLLIGNQIFEKEIEPIPIAVISFENQTGDESYNYLSKAIPNLLITNLEQSQYFRVLTWERMHDLLTNIDKNNVEIIDRELGFELCRIEGIPALVTGSFVQAGETFATDVKIVDVKSKNLLKSASAKGDGIASILKEQIDELSAEISTGIGLTEIKIKETARPIAEVTTTSMEAYNYFLRGREEYEKRYYDDAGQFLEMAVQLDSTFALAYLYLSRIYGNFGNTHARDINIKKAKTFADKATEKERLYIEASYARVIERNPEKRFDILQKIASKYPREKRVYLSLGYYYDGKKLYDKAIQYYEQALALDPYYGDAFNGLAYTYIDIGNFEKAIDYLDRYASVSPGDANPFDSMGDLYFQLGNLDQALIKYKEATTVKPDFLNTYYKIMYIYALKENYAQSVMLLDQIIVPLYPGQDRSSGGAGAFAWKSILHYWLGNQDEAMRDINEALNLWKSVSNEYFVSVIDLAKAWIYLDQGFIERGLACIRSWYDFNLQYFPAYISNNSARYTFYLGLAALQQGEIDSAKSRFNEMRLFLPKITPATKEEMTYFINLLHGEILLAQDSLENAIIVYEKTVPSGISSISVPSLALYNLPFIHTSLRDGLARAYLRKGEIDQAIGEYERLVTFNPKGKDRRFIHPKYHYLLAKLYEEKGQADKAAKEYEKFLDIWSTADDDLPELIDAKERLANLRK